MKWDVVWPLLLGSGLTLLAQWSNLAYQTRRQKEARRADFQRTTLLQLRDMLGEVEEGVRRAMDAQRQLTQNVVRSDSDPDLWTRGFNTSHPTMEALRSLTYRLRLLAAGVEHEPLRIAVDQISRWAWLASLAPTEKESKDARDKLGAQQIKAVELLGEQLRSLP